MVEGLAEALANVAKATDFRKRKQEATPVIAIHSTFIPKKEQITNCYYLLTEIPKLQEIQSCSPITKTIMSDFSNAESNQISLMTLSKELFEGTKPLEGIALKAIYVAMSKQRNSAPDSML